MRAARGAAARPGAKGVETARLFLALWPGEATRRAIADAAAAWQWPRASRRVAPDKLHATLHFLGAVARERVDEIADGMRVSETQPCVLRLDAAALWPRGIAVIEASKPPDELLALHAALATRLRALRIALERRRWRAHVTLARDAIGAVPPSRLEPIDWPVGGYALVASRLGPPATYELLRRYPAG